MKKNVTLKKGGLKIVIVLFMLVSYVSSDSYINASPKNTESKTTNFVNKETTFGGDTSPTPTPENAFKFATSSDGNYIYGYDETIGKTDVVIPETINGNKVERIIGSRPFSNKGLTSVYIPDGVKTIGDNSFSNNAITSLRLPNDIVSIGTNAFANNASIGVLELPDSVTSLGTAAFASCGITELKISAGLSEISPTAFEGNNLVEVVIPDNIVEIGARAFQNNHLLKKAVLSEELTTIGEYAFQLCALEEVVMKNKLKVIGNYVFADNNIMTLTLPNSLETIGIEAFEKNELSSLVIPDSVKSLGYGCFQVNVIDTLKLGKNVTVIPEVCFFNNKLSELVLPETVLEIGTSAFMSNSLLSFELPKSVTTLAGDAFKSQQVPSTISKKDNSWHMDMKRLNDKINEDKVFNVTSSWGTYDTAEKVVPLSKQLAKKSTAATFNYRLENDHVQSNTAMEIKLIVADYDYQVLFKDTNGTLLEEQFVSYGSAAKTPINPTPPANKVFSGWDKNFDNIIDELVVTALYEGKKQDVELKETNGDKIDSIEGKYDELLTKPNTPIKNGYTFVDWYKESTLRNLWDFSSDKVQGDMALYAKWNPINYSIAYHGAKEGANENPKKYTVESNDISLNKMADTTEYEFIGWYDSDLDNAKRITKIAKGSFGDVNLYARYAYKSYSIEFIDNDALVNSKTVQYKGVYGTLPTLKKSGFEFQGWYTKKDGGGSEVKSETPVEKLDTHKLYAYWKQVHYEDGNGSVIFDEGQDINYQLNVENISIKDNMKENENLISVYDVYFLFNNKRIKVEGTDLIVSLNLKESEKFYDHYKVLYLDENGKMVEEYIPNVASDYSTLSFAVNHLSYYGIVAWNDDKIAIATNVNNGVDTGDYKNINQYLAIVIASGLIVVVIMLRQRKVKHR